MRANLTKRTIEAIRPTGKRLRVYDSELDNFVLDVTPAGKRVFYIRYRVGTGRGASSAWYKLGEFGPLTAKQARDEAERLLGIVKLGGDPAAARRAARDGEAIKDLFPKFLADMRARRKATTVAEYTRMAKRDILATLGRKRAADLTTADLARLHASMHDRPYMANRVLATIGAFCTWCERHGHRPKHSNPAADVEPYPEHARERFLTGDELARLGAALQTAETVGLPPAPSKRRKPAEGPTAKHRPKSAGTPIPSNPFAVACLRFLMLSGWRETEARTLRWDAIDNDRAHAILTDTKSGRSVRPLGATVLTFLEDLPRVKGSPYVFPGESPKQPIADLAGTWTRVRHAAGLSNVRLHDLRHTAASIGAAGGLSLPLIGALLGHRHASTTQKYAHLADDPRRQAADRVASDVAAALAGKKTPVTPLRPSKAS